MAVASAPLAFNARLLRWLGVESSDGSRCRPALAAAAVFMLLDVVSMVHYSLGLSSDLADIAEDVGLGLMGLSANARLLALLVGGRRLHGVRRALAAAPAPPAAVAALERRLRRVTLAFIATYLTLLLVATTLTCLGPRDPVTDLPLLPLPHSLPVDDSRLPGYIANFAWQVLISAGYFLIIPSVDCTTVALLAHVALQLRSVADSLRALRRPPATEGEGARRRRWGGAERQLRRCVRHHQMALRLAQEVEEMLTAPLGIQLLCTTITLCTMAYHVTRGATLFEAIILGSVLVPITVQLYMFCYFGEEVRVQGEAVAAAAWDSGWDGDCVPLQLRRDLQFVLLRAQKPVRITGLRVAEMSRRTFGEVLKLSYSYYNLLNELGE